MRVIVILELIFTIRIVVIGSGMLRNMLIQKQILMIHKYENLKVTYLDNFKYVPSIIKKKIVF